jgi:hypothetical protein
MYIEDYATVTVATVVQISRYFENQVLYIIKCDSLRLHKKLSKASQGNDRWLGSVHLYWNTVQQPGSN